MSLTYWGKVDIIREGARSAVVRSRRWQGRKSLSSSPQRRVGMRDYPTYRLTRSDERSRMKIAPMGDRILIQIIEADEVSKGGIVIPQVAQKKQQEALVVAVGPGIRDKKGELIPMSVKKGDRIICSKYAGTEVTVGREPYMFVQEEDVVAVVERSKKA